MEELYLPVFHSFENNNVYTGSCGAFRFKITPQVVMRGKKEVDLPKSSILAECWHGPFCYENSTVEDKTVFPMAPESIAALRAWLQERI